MTASAHETRREDFALALSRFARGLSAGGDGPRADGSGFRLSEAVNEALRAGGSPHGGWTDGVWTQGPDDVRALAYRALVRRFLLEAAICEAATPCLSPRRGHQGAPAGSAALQARPVAEAVRTMDALRHLAPLERAALLLVAVERFSYAQAADFMELEEAQFVRALARAREAFAARLAAGTGRPHLRLVE